MGERGILKIRYLKKMFHVNLSQKNDDKGWLKKQIIDKKKKSFQTQNEN